MKKRATLLAIVALGAVPFVALAQQTGKVWRIGYLSSFAGPDQTTDALRATNATRVATLLARDKSVTKSVFIQKLQDAAKRMGVTLLNHEVSGPEGIEAAFTAMQRARAQAPVGATFNGMPLIFSALWIA